LYPNNREYYIYERMRRATSREEYEFYASQRNYGYPTAFPMLPITNENNLAKPLALLPEDHIVSAIIGYRAWNVPLFVDELRSVNQNAKWLPYQKFSAQCGAGQCSGVACSCGIYAFNRMDLVQSSYRSEDRSKRYVWGECWLWGRVLECKDGYRAQFAYPKAFVNSGAIAKRMAEIFGVTLLENRTRDAEL